MLLQAPVKNLTWDGDAVSRRQESRKRRLDYDLPVYVHFRRSCPDSAGVTATAIDLAFPANSGTVNEKTHSPFEFERTLFTSDSILNLLAWTGLRFEFFRAISDGPPPPGFRRGRWMSV